MSLTRTLARIWLAPLLLLAFSGASLMAVAVEAEVDVQRSGAGSIAVGATDNVGSASRALTAYDVTYAVLNTAAAGAANLTVGAVNIIGTPVNCTATPAVQPATTITPGSASAFTIRVIPATATTWSAHVQFTTTDSSEPIYDFTITGNAQAAQPDISVLYGATTLAKASSTPAASATAKGLASNLAFSIQNPGATTLNVTVPLTITSTSNCRAQVTSQPAAFIAAAASSPFTVSVTPGQGAWSFTVQILNSDPTDGFFTFTITGSASGPEIGVSRGTTTILTGTIDVPPGVTIAGEQTSLSYLIANSGLGQLNINRYPADASAGQVQFADCRYWTLEDGSATVTVQRIDGNRGAISVDWYVDSDSAISDIDFPIASGTLNWADNDISDKTFTVAIINDAIPEGTEQLYVRLHNPQGGATIKLVPNTAPFPVDATVAIEDNDAPNGTTSGGTTTWADPVRRSSHGESGPVIVQVERVNTDNVAQVAVLRVELENGTAVRGVDYELANAIKLTNYLDTIPLDSMASTVPGTYYRIWDGDNNGDGVADAAVYTNRNVGLGIPGDYIVLIDGEGKASIPVNILSDTIAEPTESFHLKLSLDNTGLPLAFCGGTVLGTATSSAHDYQYATVYINDDDASSQNTIITEAFNCTPTVIAVPGRIVAAGGSTDLPLRVVPGAPGYWQFRVTIVNDDADEPNFTWLVTGNARDDVPDIAVARNGAYIADGTVDVITGVVAGTDTVLTYTIRNDGTNPLGLTSPAVVAPVFNCTASGGVVTATTVNEGGSTTMTVTIHPTNPGNFVATITLDNTDPDENPYNITLQGTASAAPAPEFQWYRSGATQTAIATGGTDVRSDIDFIAGVDYTLEYRIGNLGSANLTLNSANGIIILPTGLYAAPGPAIGLAPASNVAAGEQTSLTFTFQPSAAGAFDFTYKLPTTAGPIFGTNDVDEDQPTIKISGTARAAAAEVAIFRDGSLIPNTATDAPAGLVATQTTVLTYGISNLGSANLTFAAGATISALSNCTASVVTDVDPLTPVAGGASISFRVNVTPGVAGPFSFHVSFPSSDSDENPVEWTVTATAAGAPVARPEIQVRRATVDIADNSVDIVGLIMAGNAQQLSYDIQNLGSDVLILGAPQITAFDNCAVQIISAPATSIPAATGSTMLLAVTPTAGGSSWSFTWSLQTNDVGEDPTNVTVVGTGMAGSGPEITVSRNGVNVPDDNTVVPPTLTPDDIGTNYAGVHTVITYHVTNAGLADLVLNPSATISNESNCTVTITTGLPGTILVPVSTPSGSDLVLDVVPTANGVWSFIVTIPNNDSDEGPYGFTVKGTASTAPAEIAVTNTATGANVVDGSTIVLNPTTTSLSYTITNVGLGDLDLLGLIVTPVAGLNPVNPVTPTSSIPVTLTPGQSTVLSLAISAVNPVTTSWSFTVSIANTDADEAPFDFTVSAPVQALIDVSRSSTDIPSDAAPGSVSLAGTLDAAADVVHGTGANLSTDLTYVISNGGVQALTVTSSAVSALTNCAVTVLDPVATSIAAGGTDNLILRVTPTAGATASGWSFLMTINSNAADDPTFYLSVSSPAVASLEPEIVVKRNGTTIVSGSNDSYSPIMATTSSSMTYVISNQGLANLTMNSGATISAVFNCSAALLTSPSTTVVPGASTNLSIQVTPTAAGAWGFTVTTLNNDPDESAMFWTVGGTAAPLAVTPGDLGLGGGGGGCGVGGALGLLVIGLSLTCLRRRRAMDNKE